MEIEELQSQILKLQDELNEKNDLIQGYQNRETENAEAIKNKDKRISDLIDKNMDLFLRVNNPIQEIVPDVLKEPELSQEETITLEDLF